MELYGLKEGVAHLTIPSVFYLTLFRFSIGNILHIRALERKELSPRIWLYDFFVISIESLIFLLLGMYTWGNDLGFLKLLLILCFVDVFWIITMIPHHVKKQRPDPLPWAWGLLNIASAIYLTATIWVGLPFPFDSPRSSSLLFFWFLVAAIIDIVLVDHYGLLKTLE